MTFVGRGLSIQLEVNAGADITGGVLGHETDYNYAAGASVVSGDDSSLSYLWTLVQAPAGSAGSTGDINNPTSLTGATFPAWDRSGEWVFKLTATRASDGQTASDTVVIRVGLGAWLATALIDYAALDASDIKAGGDDTYTLQGIDHICANTAQASQYRVVNGSGLELSVATTGSPNCKILLSDLVSLAEGESWAVMAKVKFLSAPNADYEFFNMSVKNAAESRYDGANHGYMAGSGDVVDSESSVARTRTAYTHSADSTHLIVLDVRGHLGMFTRADAWSAWIDPTTATVRGDTSGWSIEGDVNAAVRYSAATDYLWYWLNCGGSGDGFGVYIEKLLVLVQR
jgi:hypothetical protein